MKATLTSFLFFCLLSFLSSTSNAQETDSLSYYSNKISNPLKPNDLAKAYQFFTQLKIDNSKKKKIELGSFMLFKIWHVYKCDWAIPLKVSSYI
jgi:hypothetical protein